MIRKYHKNKITMIERTPLLLLMLLVLISCDDNGADGRSGHGESCTKTEDCLEGLECIEGICSDGNGVTDGDEESSSPEYSWHDPTTGLLWLNLPPEESSTLEEAEAYCESLLIAEGGWRLPTIDELRSLIRGCPDTEPGGACNINSLDCYSFSCENDACDEGCPEGDGPAADGEYKPSELEDALDWLWSSTRVKENSNHAWAVYFPKGSLSPVITSVPRGFRCVRYLDPANEDGDEAEWDEDVVPVEDGDETEEEEEDSESEEEMEADTELTWIPIPSGVFQMGCVPQDDNCKPYEYPRHEVAVDAFEMSMTEITQAQYEAITGENPSYLPDCPNCPVDSVSWQSASAFCEAAGGRLPSEAEWEYAARAGTETIWICGDDPSCLDDIACWNREDFDPMCEVGQYEPNAFGLYDMSGNVYEWIGDCYEESYEGPPSNGYPCEDDWGNDKVFRGGEAESSFLFLRASFRIFVSLDMEMMGIGFRCARDSGAKRTDEGLWE